MPQKTSVIIPCLNEESTIAGLLTAVYNQRGISAELEVVIADGMSTDNTREIIRQFSLDHPNLDIRIIDNPQRIIPAALNQAIEASSGDVIVRLDAHSIPNEDYIHRCLLTLTETNAANAGGLWKIHAGDQSWVARGIAVAAAHPLGAGGARYRVGGSAGAVDTVPFGAFPRRWIEKIGPFNEKLLTNEDYEYNVRIRNAGGIVYFNPEIQAVYLARRSFSSLARQYFRYGFWKAGMLRWYPRTIKIRQLLPPIFVASLMLLTFASTISSIAQVILAYELGIYLCILLMGGFMQSIEKKDISLTFTFPAAIAIMHFTWAFGFLWNLVKRAFRIGSHNE